MAEPTTITLGAGIAIVGSVIAVVIGIITLVKHQSKEKSLQSKSDFNEQYKKDVDSTLTELKERLSKLETGSVNNYNELVSRLDALNGRVDQTRENNNDYQAQLRQEIQRSHDANDVKIARVEQKVEKTLDMLFQFIRSERHNEY
tara:strand:- start:31129 stop:31563 length:435 start_codon:yes stop_codon:yes gene_type:complete